MYNLLILEISLKNGTSNVFEGPRDISAKTRMLQEAQKIIILSHLIYF